MSQVYIYTVPVRPRLLYSLITLHIVQNTDQEKDLLRACEAGYLETVKRLSGEVTVRDVRDHSFYEESALHKAAWLDLMSASLLNCFVMSRVLMNSYVGGYWLSMRQGGNLC